MATTIESIQQLYVAFFNRPADAGGLDFWVNSVAKGTTLAQIGAQFAAQAEYQAEYGGKSPEATVAQVYQNLFNRVPDAVGLKFWADGLRNGTYTVNNIVDQVAASAQQDPAKGPDTIAVQSKVAAAVAFTDYLRTDVPALIAYSTGAVNGVAKAYIAGVTNETNLASATAALPTTGASLVSGGNPGISAALTTGVDTLPGGAGNDTFTGVVSASATTNTVTALDTVNGGAGVDTLNLNIVDGTAVPTALTLNSVETVSVRGAAAVDVDSTTWTGVTTLKVTQGAAVNADAAGTTAIDVSGATGTITTEGGSAVTVAAATDGQVVAIGGTTAATGAVTVTHTKLGVGTIDIDTEGAVTVTASGLKDTGGDVTIGANEAAGGAVAVTTTGVAYDPAAAAALGGVAVTGGTTVSVTQNATSDASAANDEDADVTNVAVTLGAVSVTATADTTEVTVNQTASVAAVNGVAAVAAELGEQTITFTALAAGAAFEVGGLTFTASKALTAAQVAAAFANLSAEDVQGAGAAGNGIYSGVFGNLTSFTTGAVVTSGSTVTVVASTDSSADGALTVNGVAGTATTAVDEVEMDEGNMGVVAGAVTINGAAGHIAKVTLDGYGIGSTIVSDELVTLSLAHSSDDLAITNTKATTLALTVDGLGEGVTPTFATLDDVNGTYKTVNITTANTASWLAADLAGAEALNVAGTKTVNMTGSVLTALKGVTVTGSAGLRIDAALASTVTAVNASGTSGAVTLTIDNAGTTYAGGTGADSLTFSSTTTTKGANLGAGDDKMTLASGTTSLSGTVVAGDGTDTLVMVAADAVTASAGSTFEGKIDGFEKLQLTTNTAAHTVDLANLDDIKYVVVGAAATTALTLNNMLTGGTVEITSTTAGTGSITANVADADDSTTDSLNVIVKNGSGIDAGVVVAQEVETINVTVTDTTTSSIGTHTLDLTGAALKNVVITGNAGLILTVGATSNDLTMIDGSAMTKALEAGTDADGEGATIKGGAGNDFLTANGTEDVLQGGAGNDTLIVHGDLATLTGGAGADVFDIADATSNVNAYASITDLTAGDLIEFGAAADFLAAKVTLAGTAVFQDLANKAITTTDAGDLAWFQFGGNTYIIENVSDNATAFQNNTDVIVQIVGNVDLSKSSLSADTHTLLFA